MLQHIQIHEPCAVFQLGGWPRTIKQCQNGALPENDIESGTWVLPLFKMKVGEKQVTQVKRMQLCSASQRCKVTENEKRPEKGKGN